MNDKSVCSARLHLETLPLNMESRRLAALIDRLYRSQNMPVHSEAITDILNELTAYAFDTLAHEEQVLASKDTATRAAHAKEHLRFQEYIANHCLQATLGIDASKELLHFLLDWWHNHVLGTDLETRPRLPNARLGRT